MASFRLVSTTITLFPITVLLPEIDILTVADTGRGKPSGVASRGDDRPGGAGAVCQDVQAEEDQAWLHPGRRGPCHGQVVRQRLLPDDHLSFRGSQPLLQEHVQVEAVALKMVGGERIEMIADDSFQILPLL